MPAAPIRLLLVEDNPLEVMLVRAWLAPRAGEPPAAPDRATFDVTLAGSLAEALSLLESGTFDVAVLDLGLPDSTGLRTGETVRRAFPELPIVVLTGAEDGRIAVEALQMGIQDFLFKGHADGPQLVRAVRFACDRIQSVTALRASQQMLQSALDALPGHIAILDGAGSILAVNGAWRRAPATRHALGACYDVGANFRLACEMAAAEGGPDAADARKVLQGLTAVASGAQPSCMFEVPCWHAGGRTWYLVHVTRFEPAQPVHLVLSRQDVTALKSTQEAMQRRLDAQAGIAEIARYFVHTFQPDTATVARILASALGIGRLWLVRHEARQGCLHVAAASPPSAVAGSDVRLADLATLAERLGRGEDVQIASLPPAEQEALQRSDLDADLVVPIRDTSRSLLGAFVVELGAAGARWSAPDAQALQVAAELVALQWERMATDEQLRNSMGVEHVGRIVSGVAHDFNNLLNIILGCASLVRDDLPRDHPAVQELGQVIIASRRAADLTRQLGQFGRKATPEPRRLALNGFLRDIEATLRSALNGRCRLTFSLDANLPDVRADPEQLELVLVHLAVHARDGMGSFAGLVVSTATTTVDPGMARVHSGLRTGDYVLLTVRDETTALSDDDLMLNHLEPFVTAGMRAGRVLNVATCYRIVRQCGGQILVDRTPSGGTAFRIFLPRLGEVGTSGAFELTDPAPRLRAVGSPGSESG